MEIISTDEAPKAIGPYSQALVSNDFIFLSGQTPIDPVTGKLVEGSFGDMVHRVFRNLKAVLTRADCGFEDVVRVSVYLTDLSNFGAMNAIYAEYFGDHKPARSTIGVAELPLGAPVEIDMIARRERQATG